MIAYYIEARDRLTDGLRYSVKRRSLNARTVRERI